MRLTQVQITNYKSIDDSGAVEIADVTCLVGKNESGKTAFLQALTKLNPSVAAQGKFDPVYEYPKKRYSRYKAKHSSDPDPVVRADFELADSELAEIEAALGKGCLLSKDFSITKTYANSRTVSVQIDEQAIVNHFVSDAGLGPDTSRSLSACATVTALKEALEAEQDKTAGMTALAELLQTTFPKTAWSTVVDQQLIPRVPRFLYFDDYSVLPGDVHIEALKAKNSPDENETTFLALLELANTDLAEFLDGSNYERLKSELEAVSIAISDEVFEYWSQNKNLEVEFDIEAKNVTGALETWLHIRIENKKHRVTVPFSNRSRGFVWFFSFLAYFSATEREGTPLILLLDEPGLNLHAKAQGDFLRFIEERLAPKHQVIYSTHSPFMIDAARLDRVRTVEDTDQHGTVVSADVLRTDKDTVFPLQAALGYELAQTLFIGPECVLIEGPSDLIYLQVMSEVCRLQGKPSLDTRWVLIPVGGADKLSTFVSLIGANQLKVSVFMDVSGNERQRVEGLAARGLLNRSRIVTVGDAIGAKSADIEDLFSEAFFFDLVKATYGSELPAKANLGSGTDKNPRVVKRLESLFVEKGWCGGRFDHYRPAAYLLSHQSDLFPKLDADSVDRFSQAFAAIQKAMT